MTTAPLYAQKTDYCLFDANRASVEDLCARLAGYETELAHGLDEHAAPIIDLCRSQDDLAVFSEIAARIRGRFAHVIVCGSGGSGLSGRVLASLKLYHSAPQLYTLENIDPEAIAALMRRCPPRDTYVIVISKSGATAETIGQFYALFAHFTQALGEGAREHFMAITMPGDNPLGNAASKHALAVLPHPAGIGGRFSLFTAVGLLPAALVGVDIARLRQGAAAAASQLGQGIHAARLGAALQYDAMTRGQTMSVMLPYCERLAGFSAWYRQSWAESLGKGGKGTTPISAVGTTDQHSQLQLYLDGPPDKFFTLITHRRDGSGQTIDTEGAAGLDYLNNRTTGDIMAAEQQATLETLAGQRRPVRVIAMQTLNEETLGALIMHFMLEIFFMAKLLDVNAFDQPAVEEGKRLARRYLLDRKP